MRENEYRKNDGMEMFEIDGEGNAGCRGDKCSAMSVKQTTDENQ